MSFFFCNLDESVPNRSRTRGTHASWLTQDVGQSCGNLSTVANLNSTKAVQRSQHLFPAAHGTDRDFWEELEDKVADFRNVRQVENKFGSKDRSRAQDGCVVKCGTNRAHVGTTEQLSAHRIQAGAQGQTVIFVCRVLGTIRGVMSRVWSQ